MTADYGFTSVPDLSGMQNFNPATAIYPVPTGLETPPPAAPEPQAPQPTPTPTDPRVDELMRQMAAMQAQQEAAAARQREAASAFLQRTLKAYGLETLAGQVSSLVQQWGTNSEVIAIKLEETKEYKDRFKGLIALQQAGITDVRNPAEYIALETAYRQKFREAGLTSFLGQEGSSSERDAIADLAAKYKLSVNEVGDRIADAQRVAANTAPEVKQAMYDFYGIDESQIVAYSLDPVKTAEVINRQANAAVAGGLAAARGMNISAATAEGIGGIAGPNDINQGQLAADLVNAKELVDSTQRLAFIDQQQMADDVAVQAAFDLDAEAKQRVRTLQSQERARFGGSSAFSSDSLSTTSGI